MSIPMVQDVSANLHTSKSGIARAVLWLCIVHLIWRRVHLMALFRLLHRVAGRAYIPPSGQSLQLAHSTQREVRYASRLVPFRTVCLHESLALFAILTVHHRLECSWHLGCRFDPAQGHAWVTCGTERIEDNPDDTTPLFSTIVINKKGIHRP